MFRKLFFLSTVYYYQSVQRVLGPIKIKNKTKNIHNGREIYVAVSVRVAKVFGSKNKDSKLVKNKKKKVKREY